MKKEQEKTMKARERERDTHRIELLFICVRCSTST